MPPTLHPHLKRGLDCDDFLVKPEDVIEELPAGYYGSQEWAAKRRRVETIASRYLQGKPAVILSAGLRGPFNNGWKNPWASKTRIITRVSVKDNSTIEHKSRPSRGTTTQGSSTARARTRRRKETDKTPQLASPEASRAAEYEMDLEAYQRDDSLDEVEVPPATAPLPEEDASGPTEFFSVNTEKCIQSGSPLTNPFWLRRPESERTVNMNQPSHNNEMSPIRARSRNRHPQPGIGGDLHLTQPKAALRLPREDVPKEYRSSASASMVISSPAKETNTTSKRSVDEEKSAASPEGFLRLISAHPESLTGHTPHSVRAGQCGPHTFSIKTERAGHLESSTDATIAGMSHSTVHQISSSIRSQGRPSREDIQYSAPKLVDLLPHSSASNGQPRRSSKEMRDKTTQKAPQHNLVASPAPASSTGFVYRKVENSKRKRENVLGSKARFINFNSSPALDKNAIVSTVQSPERMDATSKAEPPIADRRHTDMANANGGPVLRSGESDAEANGNEIQEEQQDQRCSHSSRDSAFSTQAALLLAQIEFQESTFPTMSCDTPRPWSQPQNDTPRLVLPELSPAITPLSVFGAQLDKPLRNRSVLQGPVMSTQDLFGAASPFAFSTVKKRSEIVQQSSFRVALQHNDGEDARSNDMAAKSPTPSADRIPLKAKNTTTTLWSFVSEKASQSSLVDRSRRSISDIELPQLDFNTSLDNYGPHGDLDFTDRFLGNLDDS